MLRLKCSELFPLHLVDNCRIIILLASVVFVVKQELYIVWSCCLCVQICRAREIWSQNLHKCGFYKERIANRESNMIFMSLTSILLY